MNNSTEDPCYDSRAACPLTDTGEIEWTAEQAVETGSCTFCFKLNVSLRYEPFSQELTCKTCWEGIVYGDE